jgi:hypothetical protein
LTKRPESYRIGIPAAPRSKVFFWLSFYRVKCIDEEEFFPACSSARISPCHRVDRQYRVRRYDHETSQEARSENSGKSCSAHSGPAQGCEPQTAGGCFDSAKAS